MEKGSQIASLARMLLGVLLLAGCSDVEKPDPQLTLDKDRIVFDDPAAGTTAQAALHLETDRRWTVRYYGNGNDCRVSVTAGKAGSHDLVVETAEAAAGSGLRRLGQLVVSLDDGSASRTVDLMQRPRTVEQTLLMYFCGSDLYYYYKNNLADVVKALSRNSLPLGRIVAFTQPASGQGVVVEYRFDETANACRRDTLIRYEPLAGSTTDPEIMGGILRDMAAAAPARHYSLHLASHAKGWLPAAIEHSSWLRSSIRRDDGLWRKAPDAAETRWFGHDRGRYMDITELTEAVGSTGIHFDYLLFDACFMSSVEALYDLRHTADHIIASPCEVMAHGFPYDTVIPALFTEDGAQHDLAAVCRNFCDYYDREDSYRSACAALTVCSELEALAAALHDIQTGPTKEIDAAALQSYDGMSAHQFYDLEEYALSLTADAALGQAFVRQMERCFPPAGRVHTTQFYSVYNNRMNDIRYYSGVTTYAPAETYRADWQQTAWYAATKR